MLRVDFIKTIIYVIFSLLLFLSFLSMHTIRKEVLLKNKSVSFLQKDITFNELIKLKKKTLDIIEQKNIEFSLNFLKEDKKNCQLKRELQSNKNKNEKLAKRLDNNGRELYDLTSFGIFEQYN